MCATSSVSDRKSPRACARHNPGRDVADRDQGRGILGVIDGVKTQGLETDADIKVRKELLCKIGYKL